MSGFKNTWLWLIGKKITLIVLDSLYIRNMYFQLGCLVHPKWWIQYVNYYIFCGLKQIQSFNLTGPLDLPYSKNQNNKSIFEIFSVLEVFLNNEIFLLKILFCLKILNNLMCRSWNAQTFRFPHSFFSFPVGSFIFITILWA